MVLCHKTDLEHTSNVDNRIVFHDNWLRNQYAPLHAAPQHHYYLDRSSTLVLSCWKGMGKTHTKLEHSPLRAYDRTKSMSIQYQGAHSHCGKTDSGCFNSGRGKRQLWKRSSLCHRHFTSSKSILWAGLWGSVCCASCFINAVSGIRLCRSHAPVSGMASGNDMALDSDECNAIPHPLQR